MTAETSEIRVCVDVGSKEHYVAIGLDNGEKLDEFSFKHTPEGISLFFEKVKNHRVNHNLPVAVAMEGYNGYARPIDEIVLKKGYRLFNVNNLKLARFKEIFPAPAKTDAIDAWKIFELFTMKDNLPLRKNALQEVGVVPTENAKLKRITRRRKSLIKEKIQTTNRLQSDLVAICPGILNITRSVDNLWFLRFLTARDDIRSLSRVRKNSLMNIKGIGKKYVQTILQWQKSAEFSGETDWVGPMVIRDARRVLELIDEISSLDFIIKRLVNESDIAKKIEGIPGFGPICAGEIAGEIGNLERFKSESSLAMYLGMAVLDKSSGVYKGTKSPRSVNTHAKSAMVTGVSHYVRANEQGRSYYDKKRSEGKKHNQALRSLGRHLTRVIWSMLHQDREYIVRDPGKNTSCELIAGTIVKSLDAKTIPDKVKIA